MAAASDKYDIYLSSCPHYATAMTTPKIMLSVIIALLPLCVFGIILYGIPALVTILVSVVSCVVFEALFRKITRQEIRIKDFSSIVTGLLLALVVPPSLPVWMTVLGALFSVVVAKEFLGGLGANVFNPALSGRAFLFVSFPLAMGTWTLPFDGISGATPLSEIRGGFLIPDGQTYLDFFLGNRAGCIGESSILLILLAFIVLAALKIIDWRAPAAMVVTTCVFTWIFGGDPLLALLTGGLAFGAVFMTTDYATSPVTPAGRLIFGFGFGLITALIRTFSGYPEGVMFSILIMNAVVPFLNRIITRKYGYVRPAKEKAAK